jgi:cell division protein FtsW
MLSQATVNMFVCTGIFPVTGQNMPLLAMGGSALITTCLGLGIVQGIASRQKQFAKEEPKEEEKQAVYQSV